MHQAIIVAHGSPSEPEPQEAALRALAADVGARLPGWQIRGATLAADGSLAAALDGFDRPLIYPFFMAEGWFTGKELPRRLGDLGAKAVQLPPFGVDPDLPALIARVTLQAAAEAGMAPQDTALILAAHGSKVARRSKDSSYAMAERLAEITPFPRIEVALIEEPPFLADVARDLGRGICLPFFALRAGHVEGDIPEAIAEAGFQGPCLKAIGEHPEVADLIAAALRRSAGA
ncbi:CbiX/SirB N-terminal domain-containing protein [Phaeovulum sp. NW3]|uniref:CbiX/SirB N-terminal domain-containing protein n=1 Tax=Phaeovulum sp. NW3 TaxID=2934933 RepID=UPI00202195C1|nr:CbiX/SirB N-terminal domain-containing protein [Phaeovulum sp. NW3]MCL7465506.1 cobalamin biosynthesis protein CbiX [Phaeovulum sp. NW3]